MLALGLQLGPLPAALGTHGLSGFTGRWLCIHPAAPDLLSSGGFDSRFDAVLRRGDLGLFGSAAAGLSSAAAGLSMNGAGLSSSTTAGLLRRWDWGLGWASTTAGFSPHQGL